LECVWNLTNLYPAAFEFNEEFLIALFDHSYSGVFGTFLLNNEKDRVTRKLWKRTPSIWLYLDQNKPIYTNNWYYPNFRLVLSSIHMRHIKIWEGIFLRFDTQNFSSHKPKGDSSSFSESKIDLSSDNKYYPENITVYSDELFNPYTGDSRRTTMDSRRSTMEDSELVNRRSLNGKNIAEVNEIPLRNEDRNHGGAFQIKSLIKLTLEQNMDK